MSIDPKEAAEILNACSKAFDGHSSELQGAVLADLLSMWLAAHRVVNDPEATYRLREGLLDQHIKAVVELLRPNDEILNARYKARQERMKDKPN